MFDNEDVPDHKFERVTKREKRLLAKQVRRDYLSLPSQPVETNDIIVQRNTESAENDDTFSENSNAYNEAYNETYNESPHVQEENNQNNQHINGYHFEKYLDVATGNFYYLDTVSGETTWDKPQGYVPLKEAVLTDENKERREQEKLDAHRLAENRSFVLSKIREERVADYVKANAAAKLKADLEKKTIWRQALMEASLNKGSFHMEWKNLGYVDEEVATFNVKFSIPMVALRLTGIGLTSLPDIVCTGTLRAVLYIAFMHNTLFIHCTM